MATVRRRFSVVIVHRNGADILCNALASLERACDQARDEVIVVDNGSTDDSLARVRQAFPFAMIIENGCNNGFARACNQGLRASDGEFVLFLNNDASLTADGLARFADDFERFPKAALIGGRLLGPDGSPQRSTGRAPTFLSEIGLARKQKAIAPGMPGQPVEAETLVGACMAARRSAIEAAGSLDEAFFFYFEETEWCVRLRRQGWQVLFDPSIEVVHLKGASTRSFRREAQVEMLRSRLLYYRKAMPAHMAVVLTIWRVARLLLNTLVHAMLVAATLGLAAGLRAKLSVYLTLVAWLLSGCPKHWGLPDKCPVTKLCDADE